MEKTFPVDIKGYHTELPILDIGGGISIAFLNLHGAQELTEHCGKELAKLVDDSEVIVTAESKGLQLAHVVARELGHKFYCVCRKSKKLYMQDGISAELKSITTDSVQTMYLSKHDVELMRGKKVAIVDDVISTGGSLNGMEAIVKKAGGIINEKLFVLAEGDAKDRPDIKYLATIPLL